MIAFERLQLDETSWVDVARGYLAGADLDEMRDTVLANTRWSGSKAVAGVVRPSARTSMTRSLAGTART